MIEQVGMLLIFQVFRLELFADVFGGPYDDNAPFCAKRGHDAVAEPIEIDFL